MKGRELVLAVDPGKTTGVAGIRRVGDELSLWFTDEVDQRDIGIYVRTSLKLALEADVPVTVCCEKFTITARTVKNSQAPYSLEVIGVLKDSCLQMGYEPDNVVFQLPAAAKSLVTNEKLRRLELWHVGGGGHALDALRHGVLYLVNRGWVSAKLLG